MRLAPLLLVALCACGAGSAAPDAEPDSEDALVGSDPLAMPQTVRSFLKSQDWGRHHLEWHTVRQWDLLEANDQAWARRQGWKRADLQEGAKGNGLEFLAMHRVMIRILKDKCPQSAELLDGWKKPPTDPKDHADPVPGDDDPEFDPSKLPALERLANDLDTFRTDDEIGLYIETSMRPTASDPTARSTDKSAGIHNYIHNRFSDSNSKIDIGDPSVNLQNKRFWRLHGWIEARWTAFRKLKNLSEEGAAYKAAITSAERMLTLRPRGPIGAPPPEEAPESLRKFFERQDP